MGSNISCQALEISGGVKAPVFTLTFDWVLSTFSHTATSPAHPWAHHCPLNISDILDREKHPLYGEQS